MKERKAVNLCMDIDRVELEVQGSKVVGELHLPNGATVSGVPAIMVGEFQARGRGMGLGRNATTKTGTSRCWLRSGMESASP